MSWYVVHAYTANELMAAALLERRLGLTCYFPEVLQRRSSRRQSAALFPGYLFVDADLNVTALSAIDSMPGVVRLVRFQADPQPIAAELITQLRCRVAAINDMGGLPRHRFQPGDPVRITAGPLEGLEAVFAGPLTPAERVSVLLRILGGERTVTVPVDSLEPLPNPSVQHVASAVGKRPRRTRGTGRPVHW